MTNGWLLGWGVTVAAAATLLLSVDGGELKHDKGMADPDLDIEGLSFRRTGCYDSGSAHFILTSRGGCARVVAVVVRSSGDGERLDAWGDGQGVFRRANSQAGQVEWVTLTANPIPAGGVGELTIGFHEAPTEPVAVMLETARGAIPLPILAPRESAVRMGTIGFDSATQRIYVYLHNDGDKTADVAGGGIICGRTSGGEGANAVPLQLPKTIAPGRTGVCFAAVGRAFRPGERWYCKVNLRDGGQLCGSTRYFDYFPIDLGTPLGGEGSGTGPGRARVLGEGQEPQEWRNLTPVEVALREMERHRGDATRPLSFTLNHTGIADIVPMFGRLTDTCKMHCQPLGARYVGYYSPRDPNYTEARTRYLVRAMAPRPATVVSNMAHEYGAVGRAMTAEEIRLRAYSSIARGARGLFFRTSAWARLSGSDRRMAEEEMRRIGGELRALRPLLQYASFVEGVARTEEPLVEAATLAAGERAIVVVLLNHDHTPPWPSDELFSNEFTLTPVQRPFRVDVELGGVGQTPHVMEIGGAWSRPVGRLEGSTLSFEVDRLGATRQFVVCLDPTEVVALAERARVAMVEYPTRDLLDDLPLIAGTTKGPAVRFARKQYAIGKVDPAAKELRADFAFRNVGDKGLEVRVVSAGGRGTVTVLPPRLTPGAGGEIVWTAPMPEEGIIDETVRLATNDPASPSVDLRIGGIVAPEVWTVPQKVLLRRGDSKARVEVMDGREALLEISDLRIEGGSLAVTVFREDRPEIVDQIVDLERRAMRRRYVLDIEWTGQAGGKRELGIVFRTNAPHRPIITVPVCREEDDITIHPPRAFFGVVTPGQRQRVTCVVKTAGPAISGVRIVKTPGWLTAASRLLSPMEASVELCLAPDGPGLKNGQVEVLLEGATEIPVRIPAAAFVQ